MSTIAVKLKDNSVVELPQESIAADLAQKLNLTGPDQALGASINGQTFDLSYPLKDGDQVFFWHFDDPEGKEIFWHTSAHILAQAVLRLWPQAKLTIGPPIENGFYYDFADVHITEDDLPKIEKEMEVIVKENHKTQREELTNRADALEAFKGNKYKLELIEGLADQPLSAYRQGEFFDLCRGPHMPNLGKVKAIKVLKIAGAYWRGDATREMLTRIYAITFPSRAQLKEYLKRLEEAKKRDHKVLGPRLGLFSLHEEAPGMPFIHPEGMLVWNALLEYLRFECTKADYREIKTPVMAKRELWETSGHWQNFRENMYTAEVDEDIYAIKPMNCPGCMLFYKTKIHSYRDLPLRVAEIGHVHRHEASGAISGLLRVRSFHQDDAHIFMKPEDVENELYMLLELFDTVYSTFGLSYHLELSTRPEEGTIGSDADWELTTEALRSALEKSRKEYKVNEGDGAFYGPKIDFHIKDAIGRTWQCGTIQLDMSLPMRFDLHYDAADGSAPRPIMLHRAIFGSLERFFAILIEHFSGRFPLWLSPRQVRLLPVADRHVPYAREVQHKLKEASLLVEVDEAHQSVSKKVRDAQINQVNYILTIGDREVENRTISLRTRDNIVHGEIELETFISVLAKEKNTRSLTSPFKRHEDNSD